MYSENRDFFQRLPETNGGSTMPENARRRRFKESSFILYNSNTNYVIKIRISVSMDETIILPVILYVCETWSLTLREEHRLKVFENRVLRRIFGPK
jgi:hypothetical protein